MKIPPNMSEEQVLKVIERVVSLMAPKYVFGYMDVDDIKQEGRIRAMEAMSRYKSDLPLENFLVVHVRNRLINFRRDKFHRNDPPCWVCANAGHEQNAHSNGFCKAFLDWRKRNAAKAGLMEPGELGEGPEPEMRGRKKEPPIPEPDLENAVNMLTIPQREAYLRMRAGERVSRVMRTEVEDVLKEGLCLHHYMNGGDTYE